MEAVKEYILSVTATALICGGFCALFGKKGTIAQLIRLLCGVFVSIAAVGPFVRISIDPTELLDNGISADAEALVADAVAAGEKDTTAIITEQTEAYILDKASAMGCDVEVSVTVSETAPYAPVGVEIRGKVSPSAKKQLSAWLEETLAISGEGQNWIG